MAKKNDSWGIEVGANAIKAMRLVRNGNRVELADYDILPFKQILTTPDLNVEEAIQVNLDTFLSKHEVSKSTVMVSVPGHAAFARFAKLPPVEPKQIPGIVRYEAVQQIPFPIEQVEWDYQVFQQEESPDVQVGIFAITKERIMQYLDNYRRVNLNVDGITLSPLGVYNAFAYENALDTEPEGTIYLDIGTTSTDVIISEQDGIWMRTLPIGGNNFTEALVRSFKLSYPKAEKLKREAGTSKYARQIFQAMRPVFADLVQELQRSLGYYQSLHRDSNLTKLVGVGSTFRLPGLQKFLKQQLQMEIKRPDAFERIEVEGRREAALAEHAMNMYTAYGLALQGLGMESISANLLPSQIQVRRMWKAKEPWVAAAAACVVAASGIVGARYFAASAAYHSGYNQYHANVEQIHQEARGHQQEWSKVRGETDPREQIDNYRSMLQYRELQPKLFQDITAVVNAVNPQPELLSTDYEKIKQIPRAQRRRLYVETVDVKYDASQALGEESQGFQPGQSRGVSDFWPEYDRERTMEEYQEQLASKREQGWAPPRFTITVTGTTPHARAAGLLSANVVTWLREHQDQLDRPYRIVIDDDEVMSVPRRVGGVESGDRTGRDAPRNSRNTNNANGNFGGLPGMDGGAEGDADGTSRDVSFDQLYPEPPLGEEPKPGDWQFQVKWTVELRQPELAQRSARHEPGDGPPDGQDTQDTQDGPDGQGQEQDGQDGEGGDTPDPQPQADADRPTRDRADTRADNSAPNNDNGEEASS